jgi:hypothetical protein
MYNYYVSTNKIGETEVQVRWEGENILYFLFYFYVSIKLAKWRYAEMKGISESQK